MKFRNRRTRSLMVLMAVGALALAGCSSPGTDKASEESAAAAEVTAPSNLVNAGKLSYGVAAGFPPFEFKDSAGELTGFDIEMAEALAGVMGLTAEPLDMDFSGLIPALTGNRVDIINSAMYINEEREAQVDFVPYMRIGEAILVPEGNPENITSLDDLAGMMVTVTQGAIEEVLVTEHNETLKAAGQPEIEMLILASGDQNVQALKNGRADAMLTSTPGAAEILIQVPDTFEVAGTFANETLIGLAVRKGDTEMQEALQASVALLNEQGELERLAEKYNIPTDTLDLEG